MSGSRRSSLEHVTSARPRGTCRVISRKSTLRENDMADIPRGYKRLEGSLRHPSRNAELLGPADDAERLEVTISLRRRTDGAPLPDFDHFAKTPPNQRQRMSQRSFAADYGAHPDDIKRVEEFARS